MAALALGATMIAACAAQPAGPAKAPATPADADLRGATISGVFDRPVTLADGRYEGPPDAPGGASRPTLTLWDSPRVTANLDGSPGEETAVLLSEASGGSGERVYLAVIGMRSGKATSLATTLVGDRVKLRSMALAGDALALEVVQAGPGEPLCCGTQLARRLYALKDGALVPEGEQITGSLSLAALEAVDWRLHTIDRKPLPAGTKAPTLRVESGQVGGFGGCNRYMGGVTEISPGSVKFTRLASTMMACEEPAMQLEQRYLRLLSDAASYTFLAGRLALVARDGDQTVLLEFDRGTTP
jgi:heat shock protein HslJ